MNEINEKLKGMIADPAARVRVIVQTGYDEAGMIATTSGYLRLAQALIELIVRAESQNAATWTVNGMSMPGSSAIGSLFGAVDEVRIDSVMLAATEHEVNETADYFLLVSPPAEQPTAKTTL